MSPEVPPTPRAERRAQALVAALRDGLCIVDGDGRIVEVSERLCEMTGFPAERLVGALPPFAFWPEEEHERIAAAFEAHLEDSIGDVELVFVRSDGERFPALVTVSPMGAEEQGFLCVVRDVGREVAERQRLQEAQHVARLASWEWDAADDRVALSRPLETPIGIDLPARPLLDHALRHIPAPHDERLRAALHRVVATGRGGVVVETPIDAPNGAIGWIETRMRPVRGPDGRVVRVRGTTQDVSDHKRSERRLKAARDELRAITDSIGEGLCTVDVDGRLTYINPVGAALLGWSPDELLGRVVSFDGEDLTRRDGAIIPVEVTSAPFETAEGVQGTVVVFSDISARKAEEERLRRRVETASWAGRVREALAEDRLVLHAQPIVDVTTGATVQHELLVRMIGRDGELIAPGRFIPAAEEHGVIGDLDRWVVSRAVELAGDGHPVQLNLSACSIAQLGMTEHFRDELRRTRADPSLIVVEVTETALLEQGASAARFIKCLHDLGCGLALDDFGTGYGGFTYLKRLPVDFLKIDMEFVRDLAANPASAHVVSAVVSLARGFGQRTVAEGVEDDRTLALLRDLGVDFVQGFGIARPAPLDVVLGAAPVL